MKDRVELAEYAGRIGCKHTAEIGVYDGKYSLIMCENIPNIHHICVDTWLPSRNHRWQRRLDKAFRRAQRILAPYDVKFMKMTSLEAADILENNSLDFIYIDALHDYHNMLADAYAWYPKLRKGGIFSGHDWGHHGVTKAVLDFVCDKNINNLKHTEDVEGPGFPSWYFIK